MNFADAAKSCPLYFITDRGLTKNGIENDTEEALRAGVKIIQYRDKCASTKAMLETAKKIKRMASGHGAIFLINDRLDVALAADADGIHIGQDDMPLDEARKILGNEKIIGVTAHTIDEASRAQADGADYIAASPVFATATKHDAGTPGGLSLIQKIRSGISIPIVAIGGINSSNIKSTIDAGADAAVAISAIIASGSVYRSAKLLLDMIKAGSVSTLK